ncbi:DUF4214 domain-containing protein [Stutzerimonas kunmingensis]|uniref:DUF4214 domain-containing protein n=1 Tax=Stutzerimonas kunmingensis TaxID=1211807 RepID=UPI0028AFDDE5|nr:DUF4214 domain-containing protein [Stutzerimonas kunmingensis]
MNSFNYESSTFRFGGAGNDSLTSYGDVVLGLGGNDVLVSAGGLSYLIGGLGDDSYRLGAEITLIGDSGGHDVVYLDESDYEAGYLEGKHLLLVGLDSYQGVVFLDYKGAGRIERFLSSEGMQLTAAELDRYVYSDGLGDISYSSLLPILGLDAAELPLMQGAVEAEAAFARLDWSRVFARLDELGQADGNAFAHAIEQQALPLLSFAGRQAWESSAMTEALAASSFVGFEQNLAPRSPSIPSSERVEDLALLYEAALGRRPDLAGLNYFVGNMQAGQSLQDISHSFLASGEFLQQFEQFDDRSYIEQLYLNVLGRQADAEGLDYWLVDMQQHGRTHEDVLVSFAQSAENRSNAEWLGDLAYDASSNLWLF